MTTATLRREIKKSVDRLKPERLSSVADYLAFLERPTLAERIEKAERDVKAGRGVPWRKVRNDV